MTDYVPQDLVDAFVASAANHFLSIEQSYQLQRSLEGKVFGHQGLESVRPEQIGNRFFTLKLTLAGSAFSVDITYGDREHDLNCYIRQNNFDQPYALWEWLQACGESGLLEDHGGWVHTRDRIETVLVQYERIFERLLPFVVTAGKAVESQMERQRQEQLRLAQTQQAEEEHQRLASKAAEAFHRRDYAAVVSALATVQVELTESENRKLSYARKQLCKPNKDQAPI